MSQTFTVTLVEGGRALVADGDPAYRLCRSLQRLGYDRLVLPLAVVMAGRAEDRRLMLETDRVMQSEEQSCILRAAAEDMLSLQDAQDDDAGSLADCVHHWILETPEEGTESVRGTCKVCGKEQDHRLSRDVDVKKRANGLYFERNYRQELEDWRTRLSEAENQAGLRRAA